MLRKNWPKVLIIVGVLVFTFFSTADAQKASIPRAQDRLAIGEESVKQLLPLMDTDASGNVSKQSYMKFMDSEFQRLDKANAGKLNARELATTNLSVSRFVGK